MRSLLVTAVVLVWTANFLLLMLACTRFSHG